jgi:uncharacterized protein YbcI
MVGISRNSAEVEYAAIVAVLDFESRFMKSSYQQARVDITNEAIHLTLTKTHGIAAKERLAESPKGRALLEEAHAELFRSGEPLLRRELQRVLGVTVSSLASRLDAEAGTNSIIITLAK